MGKLSDRLVELKPSPGRRQGRRRLALRGPLPAIYAVGDVHGCFRAMQEIEARIRQDIARSGHEALVVYLGDYVDRGTDAAAVLDHLSREHDDGLDRIALCGNHDDTFLRFLREPAEWMYWLGPNFGGAPTLASYGIDVADTPGGADAGLLSRVQRAIPARHVAFLDGLPILLRAGHYVFVHAGLRPGIALEDQEDEDLLWIREPFLSAGPGLPLIVVHGHTPCTLPEFAPGRIGIDTGCVFTGRLTVLKVDAAGARVL